MIRIKIVNAKYVCMKKTLGVVFQEYDFIRLCFIWWHVCIDFGLYKKFKIPCTKNITLK